MSTEERRIIDVYGEHEEELDAHAVDLFVTVQGSSFFTGRAALKKAKEIAELVDGLKGDAGIDEARIEIVSVRAEVRSTRGAYRRACRGARNQAAGFT